MNIHQKYLHRCIALAKNGLGTTYPNPMVGSVIVYNNTIIGEGWHKKAGEAHAEVNAIRSVKDQSLLKKATIYVSLEPCSHHGKTPPCSDLILEHQIPNVVIGTVDPNVQVAGRGIKKLESAGVKVTVGVLEKECRALNKRFFTYHLQKRPYIILKWAQTNDGFIAPKQKTEQKPVWITNRYSRQLVHKWRTEEQAILVGTRTVLEDNPRLDVRDWAGTNPIRMVLDINQRIPKSLHVYNNQVKTIVLTGNKLESEEPNSCMEYLDKDQNIATQIAAIAYKHQIQSVIIEGGSQTLQTFIDADLWDEARVFVGNNTFKTGTPAPRLDLNSAIKQTLITDQLLLVYNQQNL
ncbi:bifunctional diaminohydroxyphosphoribosylaminopyrimidine deaminase/5-amino-6-(5-phosphoribosylamino)uracil reductase RibD [Flavobacterium crassostreae]|uniref:Riboflavin biosynthesis protein RibD n=1 Tax=Flavobacterium crassostreae TaxID=1763534 RepID=A0A1B9E7V0_9FLAO|nr:bifunctional diaminohydroxyphosphoribosylaminopyrimidine deaminase/5-amino-6-(5-phosphoribosylamino)uracil reductase RibD [Flavobacterium crassostreae]OCB78037.1 bifunctional diaminohydroxyphosphoribosylaminopyrimidine deaminase/5-amino-6-(5-phosphoribosylamino)uracil reductase [Flavobacterium crassostreae]